MTDLELTQVLAGRFAAHNAHLPNKVRELLSERAAAATVFGMKILTGYRDLLSVLPPEQRDLPIRFRPSWTPEFKQRIVSSLSNTRPAYASFVSEGSHLAPPRKLSSAERAEMAERVIVQEEGAGRSTSNKRLRHLLRCQTPGLEALTDREFKKALKVLGREVGRPRTKM